jgi:hypothetical protein
VRAHSRQAAWVQGAILVATFVAIGLVLTLRLQRPFDRDTLAIQVSQLQSHAAEAGVLADLVRADRLAPGFVRRHAQQLAGKVESLDRKLQSKTSRPGLGAARMRAQHLGTALQAALDGLSRDAQRPRQRDLGFDVLAQQLGALHQTLKPGD